MAALQIDILSTDLIRNGYEALRQGDERPLGSLLDDDVEWRQAPRRLARPHAPCRGREKVVQAFRAMVTSGELSDPRHWRLHDVLLVGDLAAVTFSWTTPAATTVHLAHVVRLPTGRIMAIHDYTSHPRALMRWRQRKWVRRN